MLGLTGILLVPRIQHWLGSEAVGEQRPVTARGTIADLEQAAINVNNTASSSVVRINTRAQVTQRFSRTTWEVEAGTGSGFVWDEVGHVVTNFHVIKEMFQANGIVRPGSSVHVEFGDQSYQAEIIGASPNHDLAVLKIDVSTELQPVLIGSSSDLQVGQSVYALGHPYRLGQTFTTGVISARGLSIESPTGVAIEDVIQTDAAINPGNSGGPLLDSAARLIGVNTAILSPSKTSAGIGFAIPVDTVNRVVPEIISEGRYTPPTIGIGIRSDLNEMLTRQAGLTGIVIDSVQEGSPAEAAGLRPAQWLERGQIALGDIILKVDEHPVSNINELLSALDRKKAGDTVVLTILRLPEGEELMFDVTLE